MAALKLQAFSKRRSFGGAMLSASVTFQDHLITSQCPCTARTLANQSSQCCFVSCESVLAPKQTHTAYFTSARSQQGIMAPCSVQ